MRRLPVIGALCIAVSACGPGPAGTPGFAGLLGGGPGPVPGIVPLEGGGASEDLRPAEPPPPSEYRIRSGDVLKISMLGEPDMTDTVPVGPDGRISYYVAHDLLAAGRTFKELRAEIQERLREYFQEPQVSVTGQAYKGNTVAVLGQVARPGEYIVRSDTRLLDVIAMAGGISRSALLTNGTQNVFELADLKRSFLLRGDEFVPVDFEALFSNEQAAVAHNNVYVSAGDRVHIPSSAALENKVVVLGEVRLPRVVRFQRSMTLLEAVAEAGGVKPSAWERYTFIVRGSLKNPDPVRVNLRDVAEGRAPDVELRSGEIVLVPKSVLGKTEEITRQILPLLESVNQADTIGR
jgi:polysaccharide export outer membrane protein